MYEGWQGENLLQVDQHNTVDVGVPGHYIGKLVGNGRRIPMPFAAWRIWPASQPDGRHMRPVTLTMVSNHIVNWCGTWNQKLTSKPSGTVFLEL